MSKERAIESGPRVDPTHAQLHVQLDLLQLCVDPRDVLEVEEERPRSSRKEIEVFILRSLGVVWEMYSSVICNVL